MSKTIASTLCETNQIPGLPQENVFIQNLYRLPSDYSTSFQRSATSTAPVQICAVASAQADDTIGAMALQEVMKILAGMTAQAQTNSVLNFEVFINEFLQTANYAVCNLSVSNHGAPIRVSITMLIVEGDSMRIVSVGNTRAVLVHQGRVIALSEDQTVAHRYVQMGAIPADAENSHPERSVLTQYIGRFPQDGPIIPEKQIYMKLTDGDEICLLGTGITQGLSDTLRNTVLVQPALPEQKTQELISRCISNNVKGGLTVLLLRIESTLLIPVASLRPGASTALAAAGTTAAGSVSAAATASAPGIPVLQTPASDNDADITESPYDRAAAAKRAKILAIIRPIALFLGCILAGYFGLMLIFNIGSIIKPSSTPATDVNGSVATLSKVMYILTDNTPLYSDASLDKEPIAYLNRGAVVTMGEVSGTFSKVQTIDSVTGFIVSSMLSATDPTLGEDIPDMSADPTPIPSKEQTAVTTSGAAETPPADTAAPSETAVVTSEPTPSPSETTITPTATPTATPSPTVTDVPANTPTAAPTGTPTGTPTAVPTETPTAVPTEIPTLSPTP